MNLVVFFQIASNVSYFLFNLDRLKHLDCVFNFMAWFYCLDPTICHVHDGLFVINPGNFVDGGLFEFLRNTIMDVTFFGQILFPGRNIFLICYFIMKCFKDEVQQTQRQVEKQSNREHERIQSKRRMSESD